jgi:hypothetical protein
MTVENGMSVLGLLGVGGILGNYFQFLWNRRNAEFSKLHEFKEARYKCIIILMYGLLNFAKNRENLKGAGRDFESQDDLREELRTEWHNMLLFASEDALHSVQAFIEAPTADTFKAAAVAMRGDLWGGKISP